MKTTAAKLPQLTAEMTKPQFHKFKTDWHVYKHIHSVHQGITQSPLKNTPSFLPNPSLNVKTVQPPSPPSL